MCSRNCIEVRLMEREDVKQTQYWEFINGPTLALYSINYFFPKERKDKHGSLRSSEQNLISGEKRRKR